MFPITFCYINVKVNKDKIILFKRKFDENVNKY